MGERRPTDRLPGAQASSRRQFHELPEDVQVAWDRDMCHEPWVSEPVEFYWFPESDPPRAVAWSPAYMRDDALFAAYIIDDQRWYRFHSPDGDSPFSSLNGGWRTRVVTDP